MVMVKGVCVNGAAHAEQVLCAQLIGGWVLKTDMFCSNHTLQRTPNLLFGYTHYFAYFNFKNVYKVLDL